MIKIRDIFSLPQTHQPGKSNLNIFDKLIAKLILPFIPKKVRPNHVTVLRFVLIPFVIYFLITDRLDIGVWLFGISIMTDAIDGAMARYRHQITAWGKFYDPMADKLLIASTALIVVWRYINPLMAVIIILFELLIIGNYWFNFRGQSTIPQAMWAGKIKMILQSFALLFIIIAVLAHVQVLLVISALLLVLSFVFAIISLFIYNSI